MLKEPISINMIGFCSLPFCVHDMVHNQSLTASQVADVAKSGL